MEFNCPVPETCARRLTDLCGPGWQARFSVASDLTLALRYGAAYLVVTDGKVAVCDSSGEGFALPLADIKEVKIDELFGGGRLTADTVAGKKVLVSYTKACVPEFGAMCRVINDLVQGKAPSLPEETEHAYCPRCGAPLPARGENCPKCVPRREVFLRLARFMQPYRGRVILLMAATLVAVASQMAPPYITKLIVDDVVRDRNLNHLLPYIAGMLVCGVLLLLSRFVSGILTSWLASRVIADIREALHAHLERLQMRYFNRRESGEMVARVMHDTGEIRQFLFEGLPFLLVNSLSFVAIAGILLRLDAGLALLVFLPVPFLLGGGRWFWRRLIPLFHKFGMRMSRVHSVLAETIQGVKSIKVLTQEQRQAQRFNRAAEGLYDISYRIDRTFTGFFEAMFWIMSLGIAAVWLFAARRIVLAGESSGLTLGDLLAFVGYIWLFYGPLQWFTAVLNWMTHAFSGAERIFATLDAPAEVAEAPDAVALPVIRGEVAFHEVHFSYERGREVIRGISFAVAAGEMVGLVGKSGAGKSTIINLICRFYDVDSGLIAIDGHPLRKIPLEQLRRNIGIVMQEPFLFNGTILENIRFGSPQATFEQVVRASRAARAHEFILAKEDGYDTYLGEGGVTLSGGEKQRLAIARAILHDPPILILDEATSSVDSETEKAIQEAIANLIRNRTTFAIAHRLATLRNANRLIVIDDGKIVELGSHDELVAQQGMYARLVKLQSELSKLRGEVWHE
jgi:ATP-binding cassette subfamily B protein